MEPFKKHRIKPPEIWAVAWGEPGCVESALALCMRGTLRVNPKNPESLDVAQGGGWVPLVAGEDHLVIEDGRPRALSSAAFEAEYEAE